MPLGIEVDLGPGHIVLDGDPAPPPSKGAQQLPSFRPMFVVAKRSPISATAELLFHAPRCSIVGEPANRHQWRLVRVWYPLRHNTLLLITFCVSHR